MSGVKVKIINKSLNQAPAYATEGSAGVDLRASLDAPICLKPLQRCLIPTGLFIELPVGFEAQIRPRSGLAIKSGITVLNTPGTIDSDYRGEIKVILINMSDADLMINNGDRICQMVIAKYEKVEFFETETLSDSARTDQGFGHSGIK